MAGTPGSASGLLDLREHRVSPGPAHPPDTLERLKRALVEYASREGATLTAVSVEASVAQQAIARIVERVPEPAELVVRQEEGRRRGGRRRRASRRVRRPTSQATKVTLTAA